MRAGRLITMSSLNANGNSPTEPGTVEGSVMSGIIIPPVGITPSFYLGYYLLKAGYQLKP